MMIRDIGIDVNEDYDNIEILCNNNQDNNNPGVHLFKLINFILNKEAF